MLYAWAMSTSEQAPSSGFAAPPSASQSPSPLRQPRRWPIEPPEPLLLSAPPRYHLGHALRYSGLYGLPPLIYGEDDAVPTLQAVLYPEAAGFRTPGTPPAVEVLIVQPRPQSDQPLLVYGMHPSPLADALLEQLRLMLRLDDDLGVFYRLTDQDPELAWVAASDGGRLLRAPTAFEDLVQCLALSYAPPALAAGFLHELGEAIGPRTTLGRRGTPGPAAIAELPPRLYDQLIAQCSERLALKSAHPAAAAAAGPQPRRSSAGAARRAATVRRLGAALRELACLCATGALHPESLRRRPGELTRALDTQDDELWQDALHEELEWQERIRALLESLPGFRRSRGGPQAVQEMLLRLGCYDGLHLDTATRAAWEQRFHKPNAAARARGAALARSRSGAAAAAAATPAVASGPRTRDEQQAHALLLVRRIDRRVSPFSIYRGLAQALLLRVPKAAYSPRQ